MRLDHSRSGTKEVPCLALPLVAALTTSSITGSLTVEIRHGFLTGPGTDVTLAEGRGKAVPTVKSGLKSLEEALQPTTKAGGKGAGFVELQGDGAEGISGGAESFTGSGRVKHMAASIERLLGETQPEQGHRLEHIGGIRVPRQLGPEQAASESATTVDHQNASDDAAEVPPVAGTTQQQRAQPHVFDQESVRRGVEQAMQASNSQPTANGGPPISDNLLRFATETKESRLYRTRGNITIKPHSTYGADNSLSPLQITIRELVAGLKRDPVTPSTALRANDDLQRWLEAINAAPFQHDLSLTGLEKLGDPLVASLPAEITASLNPESAVLRKQGDHLVVLFPENDVCLVLDKKSSSPVRPGDQRSVRAWLAVPTVETVQKAQRITGRSTASTVSDAIQNTWGTVKKYLAVEDALAYRGVVYLDVNSICQSYDAINSGLLPHCRYLVDHAAYRTTEHPVPLSWLTWTCRPAEYFVAGFQKIEALEDSPETIQRLAHKLNELMTTAEQTDGAHLPWAMIDTGRRGGICQVSDKQISTLR